MSISLWGYCYAAAIVGLALYGLHILTLILLYIRHRRDFLHIPTYATEKLPLVTVQIPLRNERYVVRRILAAVAAMHWPRDRLEIQVLDDSDDETTALAQEEVRRLQAQGFCATILHREQPTGHKAGAMAVGMTQARGEYIAIFDADFRPTPDFLRCTVPHLMANPRLGMVQARWGHLNADYSPITRAQAIALDAHFVVEQIARNRSGLLINFNGTAGVWRRRAIEEAGGWQSDTVAEDLDLSYRAQLAGWEALYLPGVVAPAEIPPLVAAFKQQQYRWAKGAAQVLRKLWWAILSSRHLTWAQKVMALLHLSGYFAQPLLLVLLLLALPMTLRPCPLPPIVASLGFLSAVPSLLYLVGQMDLHRDWLRRLLAYPVLMLLGLGIAWSTTLALWDGLLHWGGAFVRTPKFRLQGREGDWRRAVYRLRPDRATPGEALIGIYTLAILWAIYRTGHTGFLPLALLYAGGIALVLGGTLYQAELRKR